MKIAITGASGLIGSRIVELLQNDFEFLSLSIEDMDITDPDSVESNLANLDFDLFLHLAGYTNVDGAENQKELAHKINVEGTKNVFDFVSKKNKKFIYISTDFIFDGKNPPYFEDSTPDPTGYYAQTKYEGEKIVNNNAMIVRLSYPYRANYEIKKDLVRKLIDYLKQGTQLKMITDSLITPTFVDDIAYSLKYLMNNYSPEIYHVVGADSLSPYDAANLIAKTFNLDESLIVPTTFEEYSKDKAVRSQYSQIKSKKNNFHSMKTFEEGLNEIKIQMTKL
ncbi:MAG: SDR family oxidoreductase [Candidatus Roizmanbacteria bacterium]|nr:MAG: SDR family oxidoreductase [Candidatus Roizmanbacteria bacterium]